jgi:hypothetical protein
MVGEHLEDSRSLCAAATKLMSLRLGASLEDLVNVSVG